MTMWSRSLPPEAGDEPVAQDAPTPTPPPATGSPRLWRRRTLFGAAAVAGAAAGVGGVAWRLGLPDEADAGGDPPSPTAGPILSVPTARGTVTVVAVAPGVVRVRIGSSDAPARHSYAVEGDLTPLDARVESQGGVQVLATDEVTVSVDATSGALSAATAAGVTFLAEAEQGFEPAGEGHTWRLWLPPDETCHGLGQRAFGLSLRDRRLGLWNHDARSYKPGADPLYLSVPFYLGHRPQVSYGIFWDNPARGWIDLDSDNSGLLTYHCERGPATAYVVTGAGPQEVVQRFTKLTGLMELPPLWALGYHQTRWSYRDEAHYRSVAARLRSERLPCDALHFDIDYMDGFRVFTWDERLFPDPPRLLADLKDDGFNSVAILDPGIKVDPDYDVYRQGKKQDHFLRTRTGGRLAREAWPGMSEFPDFTNPETRAWWADHVAAFAKAGFDGLWNDMNEPSTFTDERTLPDDVPHDWEGQGATHVAGGHAVYGMQMARASRDGLASVHPDRRPFVISRAGYAGLQRYATTWNGDSLATWEHLRITIPQLLNVGLSGIAFSGSDAGGFRGDPDAELYLRWMQLASMTPFFRTHSARTARERNPWTYGRVTTDRIREVIELRYRLLPYFYTLVQRACAEGVPIVRPMFFERPDVAAYQHLDDQFLLGDDVLVAPILREGARNRSVVLPPGDWYRLDDVTVVAGDRSVEVAAGLSLPLFVRAGTVLPTWPVRQSTATRVEKLILGVYAGTGGGRLYEDAGDGHAYRQGEQRTSTFTTTQRDGALTITWAREGDYEVPYDAVDVRVHGLGAAPGEVLRDGQAVSSRFEDGVLNVATGEFSDLVLTP